MIYRNLVFSELCLFEHEQFVHDIFGQNLDMWVVEDHNIIYSVYMLSQVTCHLSPVNANSLSHRPLHC